MVCPYLVPWKEGRQLVWDATCRDTLASLYTSYATKGAGFVAAEAEEQKKKKYGHLTKSQLHVRL